MKQTSLRSTTAVLAVLALVQPLPMMAQSGDGVRADDAAGLPEPGDGAAEGVLCAAEGITDPQDCRVFIEALEASDDAAPIAETETETATETETDAAQAEAEEAEARARLAQDALRDDAAAEDAADDAAAADDAVDDAADSVQQDEATAAPQAAADAPADAPVDAPVEATIAGSDTATDAPSEVTSETLTEEEARSSQEEFRALGAAEPARSADGQTRAPAAPRDRGLSDLERAGLLALGAVVVGAVLQNGQRVQSQSGDRVIVVDDAGTYSVLKDDDALLRAPGAELRTERFTDGSTRTEVIREDGTRIVTVRDVNGRALRRVRVEPDGREYLLIDDTRDFEPVILGDLPPPISDTIDFQETTDREALRRALLAADRRDIGRSFSLRQVREIVEVRALAPEINLGGITFETNSAAIAPAQAEQLRDMGLLMRDLVAEDPTELFLVEGHTDAVGDAGYNLLLSDRRAESVALAFSEYFGVGAENLIVQGYGERFLKIPTESAERLNRRVAVRRITTLVRPF